VSQLEAVLDSIITEQPDDTQCFLYADKGYDGEPARQAVKDRWRLPTHGLIASVNSLSDMKNMPTATKPYSISLQPSFAGER
jgi:hypothetical protein